VGTESDRPEHPSTPSTAPDDSERIKEITQTVLQVIEAREQRVKKSTLWSKLKFIPTYWTFILFLLTAALIGYGLIHEGIRPDKVVTETVRKYEVAQQTEARVSDHINLGDSLLDIGKASEAETEFKKALALDPTNPIAEKGLSKAQIFVSYEDPLTENADTETAQKKLGFWFMKDRHDAHFLLFIGNMYFSGYPDTALTYYEKAINEDPDVIAAREMSGLLHDKKNNISEALKELRAAALKESWHSTYLGNYGYVLTRAKNYDPAVYNLYNALYFDANNLN
jgi:tetratricopeptide (TPR) repeat protein